MKATLWNLGIFLILFLVWCLLDFYVVRIGNYPEDVHDFDWLICLGPLSIFTLNFFFIVAGSLMKRILFSALITIGLSGLLLLTIAYLGMWFHFQIGGQL